MYPRYKLKEACFFLDKAKNSPFGHIEFCFNFSAFISAARSISFAMQKMYSHQAWFKTAYEELREQLKAMPMANEMVDARNMSEKEGHKVPRIVMSLRHKVSGDKMEFEFDPLPREENILRRTTFEPAFREEFCMEPNASRTETLKVIMNEQLHVTSLMNDFENVETTISIKMSVDGTLLTEGEFYAQIEDVLRVLSDAVNDYESRLVC